MRCFGLFAFALGSVVLLHCSSSDDASNPVTAYPDGGTSSDGGPSGTSSGGGTSSGTLPGDSGADGTTPGDTFDHVGLVAITESGPSETETALFYDVPSRSRCNVRTSGVCTISACPVVSPYDPDAQSKQVDPGNVTITGGTAQPVVVMQAQGSVQLGSPWKIGDALSISSAGATVPAFTAAVVYPSNIKVTGPAPAVPEYTIPLNRATGVTFTWTSTPPITGDIAFTITQMQADKTINVECDFPQIAGTGLVPPAAVSDLATNLPQHSTGIQAYPNSRKIIQAGAYRVTTVVTRYDSNYAVFPIIQ